MKKTYIEYTDEQWDSLNKKFEQYIHRNDVPHKKGIVQELIDSINENKAINEK